MGKESIERLLTAISYPDRAGVETSRALLRIDENEVIVEEKGRYLRLTTFLDISENELAEFAGYVPGRIYRDGATLAVGADGKAFLWQDVLTAMDESALRRTFEAFLASCDWWRDRLESGRADSEIHFQDVVIRP